MSGRTLGILAATHVAALGTGYMFAPKQPIDSEVKHTGFFQKDATKVLAATVESLREDSRVQVFSYKGTAKVRTDRTVFWVFKGEQELIVPAVVPYYLDMTDLSLADVSYDDKARLVTVRLPRLILGDIAFEPENATTINGGVLTFSDDEVEALRKANYRNARRTMIAQAQQPGLLNAAKRQARTNIETYFAVPLRVAGLPDVKVAATFKN